MSYKISLTVHKRLSYATVFVSVGMIPLDYLNATIFSLTNFAAGPAWEASGIVRCPRSILMYTLECSNWYIHIRRCFGKCVQFPPRDSSANYPYVLQ